MSKNFLVKLSGGSFLAFLFLLSFGTRKIFNFPEVQPLLGFKENLTYSLFLFDIPLLVGLSGELLIFWKNQSSVEKAAFLKRKFSSVDGWIIFFASLLTLSLFLNFSPETIYLWSRMLAAIGLFFWTKQLFFRQPKLFSSGLKIIFSWGIFQSALACLQFLNQKSLGLSWLGESPLGQQILGVAKVELEEQKFIRAYGTLPHPNLLGAFLLFSLASGIWLFFKTKRKILLSGIFFIFLGLILSFSRSAWLATGLFIPALFLFKLNPLENPSSPIESENLIPQKNSPLNYQKILLFISFLGFLVSLFFLAPFLKSRILTSPQKDSAFILRKQYALAGKEMILEKPLWGYGLGNFTRQLARKNSAWQKEPWNIQPVHNLYLLAMAEVGLPVLFFFLGIAYLAGKQFLATKNLFSLLFLGFLFLGIFDHYFWTLPQGQIIFFLTLAFSAYSCKIERLGPEKTSFLNKF